MPIKFKMLRCNHISVTVNPVHDNRISFIAILGGIGAIEHALDISITVVEKVHGGCAVIGKFDADESFFISLVLPGNLIFTGTTQEDKKTNGDANCFYHGVFKFPAKMCKEVQLGMEISDQP